MTWQPTLAIAMLACLSCTPPSEQHSAQEQASTRMAVAPSPSGPPLPYVFTQAHQDEAPWWKDQWRPQCVPPGARLQIQLPGDPTVWTVAAVESMTAAGLQAEMALETGIVRSVTPNDRRYIYPCREVSSMIDDCASQEDPSKCTALREALAALRDGPTGVACPSLIYQFELHAAPFEGRLRVVIEGEPPSPIPIALALEQGGFDRFQLTLEVSDDCGKAANSG